MPRLSAGLLLYRDDATPGGEAGGVEVFIAHMGGPFWRRRDRAWTIPKGELEPDEEPLAAARREFAEEIGVPAPDVDYDELGMFRQSSAKSVIVFAGRADLRIDAVRSNTVTIELPRGSGRTIDIPEIDDARWVALDEARELVVSGQVTALDALGEQYS